MKASVAICTHNRAGDLREALLSLLQQRYDEAFEVIVVDNNSTDDTLRTVLEFQKIALFPVHYIFEERLGLSVARNRAIREANGEYVLFLDDDAIASPCWIRELAAVFDGDARIGCVGGRIDPVWEGGAPAWLAPENRTLYTILDYADGVVEMARPALPFGANMALRRSALDMDALFREDLGRVGSNLLSSEETELIDRIRERYAVYYTSRAPVQHKIPRSRISRKWLLRRIYWQGVSRAVSSRSKLRLFALSLVKMPAFVLLSLPVLYDKRRVFRNVSRIVYNNGLISGVLGTYE